VAQRRTFRPRQPPVSRADRKSEAEAALAAFLGRGGAVKQGPSVVPTMFSCSGCGHSGIAGIAGGKTARCPRCREPLL
jgi:hypothetical protein